MKVEPISDTAVSRSPSAIWPRACSTAMRADSAVPVGERSTLPGRIATAALARRPSGPRSSGAGEQAEGDVPPVRVLGVVEAERLVRRLGDAHPEARDVVRLVRRERRGRAPPDRR